MTGSSVFTLGGVMHNSTAFVVGTIITWVFTGMAWGAATLDPNTWGFAFISLLGAIFTTMLTAYGMYRKINKEYGIDERSELLKNINDLKNDLEEQKKLVKEQRSINSALQDNLIKQQDLNNSQAQRIIELSDLLNKKSATITEKIDEQPKKT